jgi:predicted nucleic acid-binding protein
LKRLGDVLIAGQALRHGATLVTANTREFQRVPGLKVDDWNRRKKKRNNSLHSDVEQHHG